MSNSPSGKAPYNRRIPQARGPRRNERIRAPEIRVIGPTGTQLGILATRDALALAKEAGLDLVEVSPNATPPVCRILDYGKFLYEQSKKEKDKKSYSTKLKEVKFRVRTDQHDYITKVRHAEEFLGKGNKVKLTLMFRGREMEHTELGFETINRAVQDLSTMGTLDQDARLIGRSISLTLSPLPANKRKPRFHVEEEDDR